MKNKYRDLIEQTFDFPQPEFQLNDNSLLFHGIDLNKLVEKYGTPLKFSFLPAIGEKIDLCRNWFTNAFEENKYDGNYHYSYCTKSSHFDFVLKECLKKKVNIETSSAIDLDIIISLFNKGMLEDDIYVLCNGNKTEKYISKMA